MEKKWLLVIQLLCAAVIVLLMVPMLQLENKEQFNPDSQVCIERTAMLCLPDQVCVSCYSVWLQDFPECCAKWTNRLYYDRYLGCIDEVVFSIDVGFINNTDSVLPMFGKCLKGSKEQTVQKIVNLTRAYEDKYGGELNG